MKLINEKLFNKFVEKNLEIFAERLFSLDYWYRVSIEVCDNCNTEFRVVYHQNSSSIWRTEIVSQKCIWQNNRDTTNYEFEDWDLDFDSRYSDFQDEIHDRIYEEIVMCHDFELK